MKSFCCFWPLLLLLLLLLLPLLLLLLLRAPRAGGWGALRLRQHALLLPRAPSAVPPAARGAPRGRAAAEAERGAHGAAGRAGGEARAAHAARQEAQRGGSWATRAVLLSATRRRLNFFWLLLLMLVGRPGPLSQLPQSRQQRQCPRNRRWCRAEWCGVHTRAGHDAARRTEAGARRQSRFGGEQLEPKALLNAPVSTTAARRSGSRRGLVCCSSRRWGELEKRSLSSALHIGCQLCMCMASKCHCLPCLLVRAVDLLAWRRTGGATSRPSPLWALIGPRRCSGRLRMGGRMSETWRKGWVHLYRRGTRRVFSATPVLYGPVGVGRLC